MTTLVASARAGYTVPHRRVWGCPGVDPAAQNSRRDGLLSTWPDCWPWASRAASLWLRDRPLLPTINGRCRPLGERGNGLLVGPGRLLRCVSGRSNAGTGSKKAKSRRGINEDAWPSERSSGCSVMSQAVLPQSTGLLRMSGSLCAAAIRPTGLQPEERMRSLVQVVSSYTVYAVLGLSQLLYSVMT